MAASAPEPDELRIELAEPDELFAPTRPNVANGTPGLASGIDRVRGELSARPPPARLTIALPRQHVNMRVERGIEQSLARYCEAGIQRVEHELKAIHREGRQALLLGLVILAVSLALSQAVLNSGIPKGIRDFFGDGLFLVAAWVGMWYPLEMLIYAGRPHRSERKLLETIQGLEVGVRPADAPAQAQD